MFSSDVPDSVRLDLSLSTSWLRPQKQWAAVTTTLVFPPYSLSGMAISEPPHWWTTGFRYASFHRFKILFYAYANFKKEVLKILHPFGCRLQPTSFLSHKEALLMRVGVKWCWPFPLSFKFALRKSLSEQCSDFLFLTSQYGNCKISTREGKNENLASLAKKPSLPSAILRLRLRSS